MNKTLLLAAAVLATSAVPVFAQETRQSVTTKFRSEFAASDTNHDGVLTKSEIAARIGRMRIGGKAASPAQVKRLSDLWFARTDANHDGKVTRAEADAQLLKTFNEYDANHDGKVGTDERAAAIAREKAAAGR